MTTETLRLLWFLVSDFSTEAIADLSQDALESNLLLQLNRRLNLSLDEQNAIQSYLRTREPLIREMFQCQVI